MIRIHSPECFQMFCINDVWDLCEEDKTQDHGVCTRTAYVCTYLHTMRTHQIRFPHIALALARWSAWWRPLWHHGDDPADLWSRSSAQSAPVQNQTFGGTCTHTAKRCTHDSFLVLHANILMNDECQKLNEHHLGPFNDVTGVFPSVSGLFCIQLSLKPQQLLTCEWTDR